jgi:hypothetical protein
MALWHLATAAGFVRLAARCRNCGPTYVDAALRSRTPATGTRHARESRAARASSWRLRACPSQDPSPRRVAEAGDHVAIAPVNACHKVNAMITDDTHVFDAFAATIHHLQAMHAVVLLRPREISIHAAFDGDYDMLFDPDRFSDIIAAAVTQSRRHGVSLTIEQHAPYKKRLCFICDNPERRIQTELWPHAELTVSRGPLRALGTISWESARPFFVRKGKYLTLEPAVAAAIYVTHLHHKQKSLSSPEVQHRLAHYEDALAEAGDPLDGDPLDIIRAVRSRTADLKTANMRAYAALVSMGVRVRILRIAPLLERARRRLASVIVGRDDAPFWPVPLLGPDGSGKTTVANTLAERHGFSAFRFKNVFRLSLLYRGFYRTKERFAHTSHKAKNLVDENMSQLVLAIAIVRWWPLVISRMLGRNLRSGRGTAIVMDRYFWDYLVKVRHADVPPSRVSGFRLLSRLVPVPSWAVVLCCSNATLLSRKNELRPDAVDFLYDFYCEQIARNKVKRVLALSTDGPLERAHRQVSWFLLPDRLPRSRWSLAGRLIRPARRNKAVPWAKEGQHAFSGSRDRPHRV